MASRAPRAWSAAPGDVALCPLPQGQLAAGEVAAALEAGWRGAQPLSPVVREQPEGKRKLSAQGDEAPVALRQKVGDTVQTWTERRVGVRSVRQAQAAAAALRARVAKARAQIEARHQRGRGQKRFEAVAALRQAVVALAPRDGVEALVGLRLPRHTTARSVRAYRGQPARIAPGRHATVAVWVDAAAWAAAVRRAGWRVYGSNHPGESWSLAQAVVASRRAELVERRVGRLTGRPRSLTPMEVPRDDHATGLLRLLSLAVRGLTRLACGVRRQLAAEGAQRAGLSAGHPRRETARPTAEPLLEAFGGITLTLIEGPQQTDRHVTALSPLQQRMLEMVGFSSELYTRLCTVSFEPP